MAQSGSLLFPFEEDDRTASLKRAGTIEQIISSAIRLFLITEPGQRRGNPVGSFLASLRHKIIQKKKLKELQKELKRELSDQFPGVTFQTVSLSQDLEDQISNLKVGIRYHTPITDIVDLSIEL